ncbi:rhodanese-like domain-containing protein, partial [Streptomyces albidoflavus]
PLSSRFHRMLARAGTTRVTSTPVTFCQGRQKARERPAAVLDVRRDSERSGRRIEGSLHIPLHTLAGRLGELPEGPVWVHCAGGMRAAVAASLLDAAGHDVVAVDDSLDHAEAAGLTVT